MITWILYTVIVGLCAVVTALAAEWVLRLRRAPTRFVWIAAAVLAVALSATAPLRTRMGAPDSSTRIDPAAIGLIQSSFHRVEQRVPASAVPYVVALWGLATLLVTLSFVVVYWRVRAARCGWPIVELLGHRVRISPTTGPLVMGLVRPEIIVPRWVLSRSDEEQRVMLAHEAAHVDVRDPIALSVMCALVALMPWNPALWIILSRIRLAIEIDCDTRVLRSGISPRSYSSLLVDVAERATPLGLAATALADDASHLHQRILAMQPRRFSHPMLRGTSVALVGVIALLAACEAKMPTATDVAKMDAHAGEVTARSMGLVGDSSVAWFVNGVSTSAAVAKQISPDSIASMEVNKADGRSQIHIMTKSAALLGFAKIPEAGRVLRRRVGPTGDALASMSGPRKIENSAEAPIVMIDGVRSDPSALRALDRSRIDKVDVLKGELATKMYGDDAKNGVIVVTTKAAGAR